MSKDIPSSNYFAPMFLMNDCCLCVTMHTHVPSEQQKLVKKLKILNCPLSHALQFSYKIYVLILTAGLPPT